VHRERRPWVHADIADNDVRLEHDLDSMIADVRTALDRGDLDDAYARLLEGAVRSSWPPAGWRSFGLASSPRSGRSSVTWLGRTSTASRRAVADPPF
jgi:hypothetical protein